MTEQGKPRLGVQLMTVRSEVDRMGLDRVLQRLAEIGLPNIEISQVPLSDENMAAFERARTDHGVEYAALSGTMEPSGAANPSLVDSYDDVLAHARTLGSERIRIGMLPALALRDADSLLAFCREAEAMARRLADDGIRLSYHNHHIEFARLGGREVLETIRAEAPTLWLELDVYWVQRGGHDPVRTLQRFAGVVDLVHLKDFRVSLPPAEAFDALAAGDRSGLGAHLAQPVQFAEVGEGTLDWAAIVRAGIEAGAAHLLIEQDDTYGRDPFESLASSHGHLAALGFGEMF
ncbi:sugar phosphate isomerase/epimerase family protein [Ruania halotolerans]|uniref:sugar phosphate isomerase/epimerase family protein n=1 Tax=Ruania halotolerans TaxID=2897773 RepID=UPI001E5958F3|nr:sugar phosphate isomerase/epimerase [Ruania halotolerans]UFU07507.1 sugar phosphate isomerase/epimerase [Ruania halotolerans]